MAAFQLKRKTTSEKTGFTNYLFVHPCYTMTVHTTKEKGEGKIQYPVSIKADQKQWDFMPDASIFSKNTGELLLPPSISFEKLEVFQKQLDVLPGLLEEIKEILHKIESGDFK